MFYIDDRMGLNDVIEKINDMNFQTPDEMNAVLKWDILMLLIPGLTKEKVKTQKKNYGRLKADSMLALCINTIVRMFLSMIYLDSRPEMPNDRVGLRSFKYLIKNKLDEMEELEDELEKVKEGKGMIDEEYHNSQINELINQIKIQKDHIEKLEFKLKEDRKFMEDKMKRQEEVHRSYKREFVDKINEQSAN